MPRRCSKALPFAFSAVWVPEDAVVHPKNLSKVFAYLAYMNGVKFIGDVTVKQVLTQFTNMFGPSSNINYRVHGVETDQGVIDCEYFVNCGGIWAREIGRMMETPVRIPICPAEHFFIFPSKITSFVLSISPQFQTS